MSRQIQDRPPADPPALPGVFVVTPIRLYRDGIALMLRSTGRVSVLGTCEEGGTAIRRATELRPEVILLDMALEDSRATARALRIAVPASSLVALAVPDSEGHVVGCAEAGIAGYVPRDGSLDELVATVMRALNGEAVCSPQVAAGLLRRLAALSSGAPPAPAPVPAAPAFRVPAVDPELTRRLTAREIEVMALIDDGLSNKQIAHRLCIEVPTVKNHVHSILEKLGARSRAEAAARVRAVR